MVPLSVIEAQLSHLGVRPSRLFKPEIRELQHILMDNEKIIAFVQGRYFGGFAVLAATDHRLLLIDKKVMFLTVEDIRYDMISEINFNSRLLDSTVTIFTLNKQHHFTTMKNKDSLRKLIAYIQHRVMEIRQYQNHHQDSQPQPFQQPLPQHNYPQPTPQASYSYIEATPQFPTPAPALSEEARAHITPIPTADVPQLVGAAAVQNSNWVGFNPYTKAPLVMKRMGGSGRF
jgi:hypothetical protein